MTMHCVRNNPHSVAPRLMPRLLRGLGLAFVLCLLQAAWAQVRWEQGDLSYGLPAGLDPLEGWIISA